MTLRQLPNPCHHLTTPDGTPYVAVDGEPHFPHEAAAADYRAGDSALSNHAIGVLPEPCWVMSCDGPDCDPRLAGVDSVKYANDDDCPHFDSPEAAEATAADSGWRADDGKHLCRACAEERHCARGEHAWGELVEYQHLDDSGDEEIAVWVTASHCLTCGKRSTPMPLSSAGIPAVQGGSRP